MSNRKEIKVVIGANFGDEGKGLMTDYFCKRHNGKILNVLFNGGMQRGHTVVHKGKRRVFHSFGAGSFSKNVKTYLADKFIVNPLMFNKELIDMYRTDWIDWHKEKHIAYVSKNCLVTLPCDIMINQFIEQQRSKDRHGSCGLGINETVVRNSNHMKMTLRYMSDNIDNLYNII